MKRPEEWWGGLRRAGRRFEQGNNPCAAEVHVAAVRRGTEGKVMRVPAASAWWRFERLERPFVSRRA